MCGAFCETLVILRDLKHHLLGYFVHIIGNTARFVGAHLCHCSPIPDVKRLLTGIIGSAFCKRPDPLNQA
jgi:hypothetical protein